MLRKLIAGTSRLLMIAERRALRRRQGERTIAEAMAAYRCADRWKACRRRLHRVRKAALPWALNLAAALTLGAFGASLGWHAPRLALRVLP